MHARTHVRTHARIQKEFDKSDRTTATRFILGNANDGCIVNFESRNLESSYDKKVCDQCFDISYKNVKQKVGCFI